MKQAQQEFNDYKPTLASPRPQIAIFSYVNNLALVSHSLYSLTYCYCFGNPHLNELNTPIRRIKTPPAARSHQQ